MTLPFVLVPHTELFTAPVVAIVCWGLFSIEEIAYFIEQPFDPVRGTPCIGCPFALVTWRWIAEITGFQGDLRFKFEDCLAVLESAMEWISDQLIWSEYAAS